LGLLNNVAWFRQVLDNHFTAWPIVPAGTKDGFFGSYNKKLHFLPKIFLYTSVLRGGMYEESVEEKSKQTQLFRQNF